MRTLDDIRNKLKPYPYYDITLEDNEAFFRHDTEDSDPKQQWDNYIDVVEDLKEVGLYLDDPQVEHDCITGNIKYLNDQTT